MSFLSKILTKGKKKTDMSRDDMAALDDNQLIGILSDRILQEEGDMETEECLQLFKGAKRVFYIVDYFDMEVQNGGLCQFFVNSSRKVAPEILHSLEIIGAIHYKQILEDFVKENSISLENLDSFVIEDISEYEIQYKRYPFDDFDEEYYALYEEEPLEMILVQYVRKHLEDFV